MAKGSSTRAGSSRADATKTPRTVTPKGGKKVLRRSRMAAESGALTRSEEMILQRMDGLDPEDARYRVLEAALAFKASWVILGEHLTEVAVSKTFRAWGFPSFARYCADEIRVTAATARKLVKSYQWLDAEAPEMIPRVEDGRVLPQREVPDVAAISVLADAKKELQAERVSEDAYLALKHAAFEGERTASQLRAELKESIPEELRDKKAVDKVRILRKALNAAVKTIDGLREWDGNDELISQAEALRDRIIEHLPAPSDS